VLLLAVALVELAVGARAERESLEDVAAPLATEEAKDAEGAESIG
jgi:hypothetical protein